jgi:hypothetical protein
LDDVTKLVIFFDELGLERRIIGSAEKEEHLPGPIWRN